METKNNTKIPWQRLIDIAIAILTVISGMIFESCTHVVAGML